MAFPMRCHGRADRSAAAWRAAPRRIRKPPTVRCQALFSSLFQKAQQQARKGKLVEKPAYRPSEKISLAPGVDVSPLGLGTWAWGNQFLWGYATDQDPELQQVYNLAVSRGINLFDTADSYGTGALNGRAEQLLGQFRDAYPGSPATARSVHIATKLAPYPWRVLPGQMVSACAASARRLGEEQVSLGQLHWSTANYAPLQELGIRAGLAEMYLRGQVRAVGVSNYGPKQMRKLHAYLAKRGVPLASAQIQYSLLSAGPLQQEAKAVADDLGVTLISYSPLALGLLSGKYDKDTLPSGPRGALFRGLLPDAAPLLDLLRIIAAERRKTVPQVAINWCMGQGTVPIPGARTVAQAQEVLGCLGWRLSGGEQGELTQLAGRLKKGMVQNIFQTS